MKTIANYLIALFVAFALLAPGLAHAGNPFTLDAIRAQVKKDYSQIQQLSTQDLAARMKQGEDILLLDVREENEFAVSRIAGAERVDPGIWRRTFMSRFGDKVRGKTVVFYCSVGVRSSRLAANVLAALKEQGAKEIYNLDGGIFAWHNESRALVNAAGPTDFVHPYDSKWGKLVDRQALVKNTR